MGIEERVRKWRKINFDQKFLFPFSLSLPLPLPHHLFPIHLSSSIFSCVVWAVMREEEEEEYHENPMRIHKRRQVIWDFHGYVRWTGILLSFFLLFPSTGSTSSMISPFHGLSTSGEPRVRRNQETVRRKLVPTAMTMNGDSGRGWRDHIQASWFKMKKRLREASWLGRYDARENQMVDPIFYVISLPFGSTIGYALNAARNPMSVTYSYSNEKTNIIFTILLVFSFKYESDGTWEMEAVAEHHESAGRRRKQ